MARPKGQPKLGGRKKGVPNKILPMKSLRLSLSEQGFDLGSELIKLYAAGDDSMKLKLLQLITQYTQVVPKEEAAPQPDTQEVTADTDSLLKAVR